MKLKRTPPTPSDPQPPVAPPYADRHSRAKADGAADAEAGVPDPDAESVVLGVRQPPAQPHVYVEDAVALISELGGEAKEQLASLEQDYLRLPRQIREATNTVTELNDEIAARGDFGRERPIARYRFTAIMACVLVGAAFEVALTEFSLSFANLTLPELRLISVGAVVAMNLIALIAIGHDSSNRPTTDETATHEGSIAGEAAA